MIRRRRTHGSTTLILLALLSLAASEMSNVQEARLYREEEGPNLARRNLRSQTGVNIANFHALYVRNTMILCVCMSISFAYDYTQRNDMFQAIEFSSYRYPSDYKGNASFEPSRFSFLFQIFSFKIPFPFVTKNGILDSKRNVFE